jgi:hypothetical protein
MTEVNNVVTLAQLLDALRLSNAIKIWPLRGGGFANQQMEGRSVMKPTTTGKNSCFFLLAFLISLSACGGDTKSNIPSIPGKWEADVVSKRSNQGSKVIFEFLPDGSFNATPPDDSTIVDKDKYQVLDEGRTVKLRSQLFSGEAVCKVTGDAMQCESDNSYINFKKLTP